VLVRLDDDDGVLAIGQLSHAWLSGQLARAWGNERFDPPEPREEVVLGAEQHDIGWAQFDLDPRLNAETGLPRSFLELTVDEQLAIWRGAPDRLVSQSLHAALVVSMHGCALSELRIAGGAEEPALRAHVDEERARQRRLRETLGLSEAQAERTRRQMWTWDGLSLALCLGWCPFTVREVPARDGRVEIELRDRGDGPSTLDPWPLRTDRVELRCEGRRLASGYGDHAELARAFVRAPPVTLTFVLAAP
jgi:hypothetical protein